MPILPPGSQVPPCSLSVTQPDGSIDVLFTAEPKQREFIERPEPNVLYIGSRGTGKSICARMFCHMVALAFPGISYCVLRRTYPELAKSHLLHIGGEMKRLGGSWHQTERVATYQNGSRGFFTHCATDADVLNLLSAEFGLIVVDEASTFPYQMLLQLATSLRVTEGTGQHTAMLRLCTNPLGVSAHELNRYYVTKDVDPAADPDYDPADYFAVHTVMSDNTHADPNYRKRFAGLPEHVRKAWVDGEYVADGALFEFTPSRVGDDGLPKPYHVIPELPDVNGQSLLRQPWVRIFRAYDHGYSPDPAVCLWIAHLGSRYIVFKEQFFYKVIAKDIAAQLIDASDGMKIVTTLCDPSMDVNRGQDIRTILDIFEDEGVPLEPSINNRELAAASIHEALGTEVMPGVPKLQIVAAGCPQLVKFLPQMVSNPNRPLAIADHKQDHPIIALAYFLMSQSAAESRESGKPMNRPGWRVTDIDRALLGTRFGRPRTRRV